MNLLRRINTNRNPTGVSEPSARRFAVLFPALILFGLFSYQIRLNIYQTSATFDEPLHIAAGYQYWQCGNYALNPEHPPLLKLLAALPLQWQPLIKPSLPCDAKIHYKLESFTVGSQFLASNGVEPVLIPARLCAALMSLLLAVLVFLAAWEMFGRTEALVALAILAFEPTLIAHGSLVTTDMAVTAMIFAAVYALYRYAKHPGIARLLTAGVACGMMLAAKHSALLMLLILFVLLIADVLLARRLRDEKQVVNIGGAVLRRAFAFAVICVIAFVVLWATYGFRYQALPAGSQDTIVLTDIFNMGFQHDAINAPSGQIVQILYRSHLLPQAYTFGLADVLASGARPTFLLGKSYPTGQWFYFPVAFTIKSSIALLVLLPLGLFSIETYKKYPREMLFLLLPAFGYFAICLASSLNIGIRHLLPVYPFFIVIAAGACAFGRRFRVFPFLLGALLIFHMATAVRTSPGFLAFANDFWGGTNNTYRLLDDSNVEWGQNYKLVKNFMDKEPTQDCWLAPLGLGEMLHYYQPCHLIPGGFVLLPPDQVSESMPATLDGTIFISTSAITPTAGSEFEPILGTPPVAMLGGSILVFQGHFEVPALAARRYLERASQLTELKRFDEAVADTQAAVDLMPDDPRAHLSLGKSLIQISQINQARLELAKAIRLAQSNSSSDAPTQREARETLEHLP